MVDTFWQWCDYELQNPDLTPKSPLDKALQYARNRKGSLEVFLSEPDVAVDTNHLERALRAILMGKKNWLFCWTEDGAADTAAIQSLIVTCRLHNIDLYTYLVDVLQRISEHPNADVIGLTPRLWKETFGKNPARSLVDVMLSTAQ